VISIEKEMSADEEAASSTIPLNDASVLGFGKYRFALNGRKCQIACEFEGSSCRQQNAVAGLYVARFRNAFDV
jgi:hypothetical protein